MDLDPDIAAFLNNTALHQPPADWPTTTDPITTARFLHERKAEYLTPITQRHTVGTVEDRTIPGPATPIPVRIYTPEQTGDEVPAPIILWMHGGGWITGSLETGDIIARAICSVLSAIVVSVDYRLAPERPFPAGLDDCAAALRWTITNAADLGGSTDRILVGGDSAGGNLAAVLAHTRLGTRLAGQILLYPAVDLDGITSDTSRYPSRAEKAQGYGLELAEMTTCYQLYPGNTAVTDPRISPLRTPDMTAAPPAVIAVAEHDPLRDEGYAYAHALTAAGVPTTVHHGEGLVHGCYDMLGISAHSNAGLQQILDTIKELLS